MTTPPLRVLSVSYYGPSIRSGHAGGSWTTRHLHELADRAELRVVVPAASATADLDSGLRIDVFPTPRRPLHWLRYVTGGLNPGPDVLDGLRSWPELPGLLEWAGVIEIQYGVMLPLVGLARRYAPSTPIVVHHHDVITQSLRRRRGHASSVQARIEAMLLVRRTAQMERDLTNRCDLAMVFSDKDVAELRALGVTIPIETVRPELHISDGHPSPEPVALFVGAMDRRENADGVRWFLDDVWPRVVDARPDARFIVAGAQPPSWLVRRTDRGLDVRGFVDDLTTVYAESRVVVAPLLFGAGLPFKVPQALARGLPVVATPLATEGLPTAVRDTAAVASGPGEFAAAVVAALSDGAAETAGAAGRDAVRQAYGDASDIDTIVARYRELVTRSGAAQDDTRR